MWKEPVHMHMNPLYLFCCCSLFPHSNKSGKQCGLSVIPQGILALLLGNHMGFISVVLNGLLTVLVKSSNCTVLGGQEQ